MVATLLHLHRSHVLQIRIDRLKLVVASSWVPLDLTLRYLGRFAILWWKRFEGVEEFFNCLDKLTPRLGPHRPPFLS